MGQREINSGRTILVSGATGKQGGGVLRAVRPRGYPVRAITRDATKPNALALAGPGTEVFACDMENLDSLRSAMDGVYGVFSVQQFWETGTEGEIRQGRNLADAAQRNDISHFVYSSVGGADRAPDVEHFASKYQVEQHVQSLGMPFTVLRPAFFMENWLGMKDMLQQGTLMQPLSPDTRLQMIASDDIGEFAALAFDHPATWQSRTEEIAGDELSMTELAQAFSRALGRDVHYQQISWDQFEQQAGHEMAAMYKWFEREGYRADIPGLRGELPGLRSFEAWSRQQSWA
jgi:uncharacterized protein YbjT (DUF2867 family)